MRIHEWDPADESTARACYAVFAAAAQEDETVEPVMPFGWFECVLRYGWNRAPWEVWVASADDGTVIGYYKVGLPDLENRDKAFGGPVVHPAARRRGIGRELLRHEGGRAKAHGRTLFEVEVNADTAGDAFARAVGARLDLQDVRRIQYLREVDPATIAALRAEAEQAAAGYRLISWDGLIPDEHAAAMARVFAALDDAPHGENDEPRVWDEDRVRERTGLFTRHGVVRSHSVAAVAEATGEIAAFSGVDVVPEEPQWGWQELTAVVRAHRGHRLGLLVKTAMLGYLAEVEPQLEQIETGNAAGNKHMIGINERLGYRVVEPGWNSYEMPVASLG